MATSYRFTEDEFVFLAYFYQCMTVPAWFLCEPEQIDPERRCGRCQRSFCAAAFWSWSSRAWASRSALTGRRF